MYNDMLACAWRNELAALPSGGSPPTLARRGGLSNRAQLPDAEALAALVQVGGAGVCAGCSGRLWDRRALCTELPSCPHGSPCLPAL